VASFSAVRALRAIHALAWGLPLGRFPRAPAATLAFVGWGVLFFAIWALGGWARKTLGPVGLPLTIALLGGFFLLWLAVSMTLPHPPGLSWRAFVPGALLVAVGMEAIHLATVLYIAHKAEQASASYGALGIALVLLLWLYLLGRLIVASAFLNATIWENRGEHPPA
jgi:membrane protein